MKPFLKVLAGEKTERPPIWLMRQAGRYMPEYRAVRKDVDFLTLCHTSELAAQVTLEAVEILDSRTLDFEYDGEMSADVALDPEVRRLYPFCRLSGPANVLVMPALHSANISYKLLQRFAGGSVIGPMLMGLEKPAQIVQMGASVTDIVNAAAIAAHEATIG